jgi:uncharacterized protein (TIRG00374 family)
MMSTAGKGSLARMSEEGGEPTPSAALAAEEAKLDLAVAEAPGLSAKTVLRVGWRIAFAIIAVAIAGVVLFNIFEDLDFEEIGKAIDRLSDAEWLSLFFGWLIWIGTQGLQTASLVHHLPARRGVVAYLGPSAVSSLIPGPSDLPIRYSMYQSWGVGKNDAATAVAASGIFSVGSQLALPALAGLTIFFADIPLEGFSLLIVATTLALGVVIVLSAFILGSARRTARAGAILEPLRDWGLRVLRRPEPDRDLSEVLTDQRATSLDYIKDKWVLTSGATVLTILAKCSLLIMSLRFVGIPEDDLSWLAIFAVFALVAGLTMIPITPGAAGVAEVGLVGMLTPIAGSEYVNEIAAGVLIYRLLTWILLIPTGFGMLLAWRLRRPKPDEVRPKPAGAE